MSVTLPPLPAALDLGFDDVIDVRSPSEFAEDHIPGAINLPVLDDAERAEVGTIYVRESPFTARKLGAALVAANAARHLRGPLADRPGGWRPLVYCWRGGQRSNSFATILGQIGWRVEVVEGGWKSWRARVVTALYETPFPAAMTVLDGNTGSAKTAVLHRLAALGVQTIDLEGLANHRGSLFGAMPYGAAGTGQPSQKGFETALASAIARLDPARPVVVEAESSRVGERRLPPEIWKAIVAAPRIEIRASLAARADYLTRAYADVTGDAARLGATLDRMRTTHGGETVRRWRDLAHRGDHAMLAAELMERHYDPRYEKHRARIAAHARTLAAGPLDEPDLDRLAAAVRDMVTG